MTGRRWKAYPSPPSWTEKRSLSPRLRSASLSSSSFPCSRQWWRWEDDQGDVYDKVLYRLLLLNTSIALSDRSQCIMMLFSSACSSCFLRSRRWWFSHSENHETDMKNSNRLTMPWMRSGLQKCSVLLSKSFDSLIFWYLSLIFILSLQVQKKKSENLTMGGKKKWGECTAAVLNFTALKRYQWHTDLGKSILEPHWWIFLTVRVMGLDKK